MAVVARKSTGTSGELRIEDTGSRVYFIIANSQSATFAYGKSWSGRINGVNVSGKFDINGVDTVSLSWPVSSPQTVTFTMGATGTSGLGGPTTISAWIARPPTAPGTPSVSSIDTDQATFSWSASANSPDRYGVYVSLYSDFRSHVFAEWVGSGRSYRLPVGTLNDGTRYYVRVRASNEAGTGGYSGAREFWSAPGAPTSLAVQRVSDGQHTLSWTRQSTYTGVLIDRRTDGGSWQRIASPSGNLSSFTDTTTQAGRKYEYRVAGKNASGASAWSNTVTVFTTPTVPSAPVAVRTTGDDIRVSVTMGGYGTHLDIQDEGSTLVSALPKASLPWDHVSPNPASPHRYRARARVASGGIGSTTLYSAWSGYSNTIQLISPPSAPVSLSPNGGTAPSDADVALSWVHNPVDSSPQSAFEVRHRPTGGAWTTISGTTAETAPVPLGVGGFEWEVRTKGAHPDWSPWSATAVVEVIDRPGVAIIQPDMTWNASILDAEWTFFQAQSHPQSGWELELVAGGAVIERQQGDGPTVTVRLNSRLPEGSYELRVRAAAGDVWSDWTVAVFEVAFIPPAPPVIAGVWDESQGGVVLSVAAEEYGGAVFEGGAWYTEVGV